MPTLQFLFDEHVHAQALEQLRKGGVDVVHVTEVGLAEANDPDILAWAARENRIVITRNYRDFAPLAQAYARRGTPFPGVLFYASSVRQSDIGHHVRALKRWVRDAEEAGGNPVRNGLGWLG